MFKWLESRVFWGSILILGGILFLLQNLGIVALGDLFWAVVLIFGGLFFIGIYVYERANWWALIPGSALLATGVVNLVGFLVPRFADFWGGLIIMGSLGLAFLVIYWNRPGTWWAIIPAGVMLTLGFISLVDNLDLKIDSGGLLFIGLGLTFAIVAMIPRAAHDMRWAWIPAIVLFLMGVLMMASAGQFFNLLGPILLILAGGYLLLRTFRPRMS